MIKDILKLLLATVGIVAFIYFVSILFVPMRIGEKIVDRKVVESSQQYTTTKRESLVTFYTAYTKADDDQKQAILGQMCQIASSLQTSDIPSYIRSTINLCR